MVDPPWPPAHATAAVTPSPHGTRRLSPLALTFGTESLFSLLFSSSISFPIFFPLYVLFSLKVILLSPQFFSLPIFPLFSLFSLPSRPRALSLSLSLSHSGSLP